LGLAALTVLHITVPLKRNAYNDYFLVIVSS
jgi:hypothetical protein